jgi:hypothetical protein
MVEGGRLGASLDVLLDVLDPEGRRESVGNEVGTLTLGGASLEALPEDVEPPPPSPPDDDPPPDEPDEDEPPLVRGMAVWAARLAGTANAAATESTMSERE